MEVIDHFKTVAISSPLAVFFLYPGVEPLEFAFLALYGIALGVLIDLDHFLLARLHTGDWRHLRLAIKNPLTIITDCQDVVEGWTGEKGARNRLITHSIITFTASASTYILIDWRFAALTAINLIVHIMGDIYAGITNYWK